MRKSMLKKAIPSIILTLVILFTLTSSSFVYAQQNCDELPDPKIDKFIADKYTIAKGEEVALTWWTSNADYTFLRCFSTSRLRSCEPNTIYGEHPPGDRVIVAPTLNTTYELTAIRDLKEECQELVTKNLTITVKQDQQPNPQITPSKSNFELTITEGKTKEETFTVSNTGNVDLKDVQLTAAGLQDDDEDKITFILDPAILSSLAVGASKEIKLTVAVEDNVDIGSYEGKIIVKSDQLTRDVPIKINIEPEIAICSTGTKGLEIDIEKPEEGEDLLIGDEMQVELTVENNRDEDVRVKLKVELYNLDKDKVVEEYTTTERINEDDEKTFKFTIILGEDINIEDDYTLYIKAYESGHEDNNCDTAKVKIDVDALDHHIAIKDFTLLPMIASCGDQVSGSLTVKNIGANEETLRIKVTNSALGINEISIPFELEEYDRTGNDRLISFDFTVPKTAKEGNYAIEAKILDFDGIANSVTQTLTVTGTRCGATPATTQQQTGISTIQGGATAGTDIYTTFQEKDMFDVFGEKEIPTLFWILVDLALLVVIIAVIVYIFKRK